MIKQAAGVLWAHCAIVLGAGLVACSSDSSTPPNPATGQVSGTVRDARTGLALQSVTITVGGRTAQVGPEYYSVNDAPVGRQQITATLAGYVPFSDSVDVIVDVVVTVNIALTSSTAGPLAPTGLTAVAGPVAGSVVLTWNPVDGATSYTLYTSGTKIPDVTSPYQQNGLSGGVARQYAVTATGAHGESALSQPVSIVPVNTITLIVVLPAPCKPFAFSCPPIALVDSVFSLGVKATSQFSLASLVARVGTKTAPFVFVPANGRWEATVSLAGLQHPSVQQLDLVARDVQGDSATLAYAVRYDKPPVVTLTLPQHGAVARPNLAVQATCQDDGPAGCVELRFTALSSAGGNTVASGTASINQTVSLAAYEGQRLESDLTGRDDTGQERTVRVVTYVESSPRLTAVASAGHGTIVDADATRLLVVDVDDYNRRGDSVRIVARSSGMSTTILADTSNMQAQLESARLTPHGAIFLARGGLYEWRDDAMIRPAGTNSVDYLAVEGDFATWTTEGSTQVRRNLAMGTNQTISNSGSGGSVALNGDVAYTGADYNIRTYSSGTTTQLTADGKNWGPVTDGTHVVFGGQASGGCASDIILFAPGSPVVLATITPSGSEILCYRPEPGRYYRVNNGWIGFVRPDAGGVGQAWIRSAGGAETQLSFLGASSFLKALSMTGEVVFDVFQGRRYRAAASSSPIDIGSTNGRPLYIDGLLHVALGATLFVVN